MAEAKKKTNPLEILKQKVSKKSTAGTLRDRKLAIEKKLKEAGA